MKAFALPEKLRAGIAQFGRTRTASAAELSHAYRAGRGSREIDIGAYLTARMPATYAAVAAALAELRERAPDFAPRSSFDAGAGPGTASWAAAERWPTLESVTMLDSNAALLDAARALVQSADNPALRDAGFIGGDIAAFASARRYDLVVASYTLAELPETRAGAIAARLWELCAGVLVLVEPGTPQGFARIRAARDALIAQGANIAAPCAGNYACPIAGSDWCHFAVRLPRSRAHMRAKDANVPFEDEKFSYLAVAREGVAAALPSARILARPHRMKSGIRAKLCTPQGLEDRIAPARDKEAFRALAKKEWGDAV